jgi:hypothetical protein
VIRVDDQCQSRIQRCEEEKMNKESVLGMEKEVADLQLHVRALANTVDARMEVQRNQYGKLEKRVAEMEEAQQQQVAVKRPLSSGDEEVLDLLREELVELLEDAEGGDVIARYGKSIVNRLISGRYKLVLRDIRELKTIFNCPTDLMHVLDQIAAEIN